MRAADSEPEVASSNTAKKPRHFDNVIVLLVAVSEYESPGIPSLKHPITDALDLKKFFESHYGYKVETLFEEKATAEAVVSKVTEIGMNLGANDAFIIHFGGHGMAVEQSSLSGEFKGYYVTHDATVSSLTNPMGDSWQSSVIEMGSFSKLITGLSVGHIVLLADCCKSGFAALTTSRGDIDRRDLSLSVMNPSCSVVTATTSKRTVSGRTFTPAVKRALGSSQTKSLCEVVVEVKKDVADAGLRPQHTQFREDGGDFVFIPLAVAQRNTDEQIQRQEERLQKELRNLTTLEEALLALNTVDYRLSKSPFEQHEIWKKLFEKFDDKASVQQPRDELAQFALYQCWRKGLGVEKASAEKAFYAAAVAYQSGSAIGKLLVGDALYRGVHVAQNKIAGRNLLEMSAKSGSEIAKFALADILLKEGRREDQARALELFREASTAGVINADIALAQAYSDVFSEYEGVRQNIDKAIEATKKLMAEENGPAEANYQVFLMQSAFPGRFPDATSDRRIALLLEASEMGFADAHVDLAKAHLFRASEFGLEGSKETAKELLQLAAQADNREAHNMLSFLHSQGDVVELNYDLAKEHAIRASELGSGQASCRLGVWYRDGSVVEKNPRKAFEYFRRSALQENAEGCKCLGAMYDSGEGPAAGLSKQEQAAEATHWLMKACELGSSEARDLFVSHVTNKYSHVSWRGADRVLWNRHPDSALSMIRRAAYRARYISGRASRVLPGNAGQENWLQIAPENTETVYVGGFAIGERTKASFYAAEFFILEVDYRAFCEAWFALYRGSAKKSEIIEFDGGLEGRVSGTLHERPWLEENEQFLDGYKTVLLALDGNILCDLTGPAAEVDAARDAFIEYATNLRF